MARKTATELNITDISQIQGTGPNNRIIEADVIEFHLRKPSVTTTSSLHSEKSQTASIVHAQPTTVIAPSTVSTADYKDIPISNIRKVIAERLVLSKSTIPHFYLQTEFVVDKMIKLRTQLNDLSGIKISFNDIVIKAASIACTKIPETNSSWQQGFIRQYLNVDMSVAVQTDNGLITPIIKNSNLKRLAEISSEMKDLATRAKAQKLKPAEFQGGTFTISNLGMMGISSFSAIINPPQSCILAVGSVEKKVVFDEHALNKDMPYKYNTICYSNKQSSERHELHFVL